MSVEKQRICKLCGENFEIIDKGWTRKYCYNCSPSYSKNNTQQHAQNISTKRNAIKKYLIQRAGGKCIICGYDKCQGALQFHHPDPNQKDFEISKNFSNNIEKLCEEADKCNLLCANCHAEEHWRLTHMDES